MFNIIRGYYFSFLLNAKYTILIILIFCTNNSKAQVNLTNGLVAYYPFNGNANDVSGNGNHPVFNNATLIVDRYGKYKSAYHFNGSNSYMKILNNNTLNFNSKLSISAWVKIDDFYEGPCHGNRVIMKGDNDFNNGNYFLTFDDNDFTDGQNCVRDMPDKLHQSFYAPIINVEKRKTLYITKRNGIVYVLSTMGYLPSFM